MTEIYCTVHNCTAESFIARCFYSLWAQALEPCKLREMLLTPVEAEGQEPLFVNEQGTW